MIGLFSSITGLSKNKNGAAAVEFALVAPFLIALLLPMVDLGMGVYANMRVQSAAQIGGQFAVRNGWNSTAVTAAVQNAVPALTISASPAPAQSCGCVNNGNLTLTSGTVNCDVPCADGSSPGVYVTVNAQYTYTPLFPYPALGNSVNLTAQSTVRIQ